MIRQPSLKHEDGTLVTIISWSHRVPHDIIQSNQSSFFMPEHVKIEACVDFSSITLHKDLFQDWRRQLLVRHGVVTTTRTTNSNRQTNLINRQAEPSVWPPHIEKDILGFTKSFFHSLALALSEALFNKTKHFESNSGPKNNKWKCQFWSLRSASSSTGRRWVALDVYHYLLITESFSYCCRSKEEITFIHVHMYALRT